MTTPTIRALQHKHQTTVNRMYLQDRLYHLYVDMGDAMESVSNGTIQAERELTKNLKLQENAWEKAQGFYNKLPKTEQRNAEIQYKEIHGYNLV